MSVTSDMAYSDALIEDARRRMALYFGDPIDRFSVASEREDWHEATDITIKRGGTNDRIAVRSRTAGYHKDYPFDVTYRYRRPRRTTEWQKIMSGWGEYNLYGFGDTERDPKSFAAGYIIDLRALRRRIQKKWEHPYFQWLEKPNKDGSSSMLIFDVRWFGPNIVLDHWGAPSFEWYTGMPSWGRRR